VASVLEMKQQTVFEFEFDPGFAQNEFMPFAAAVAVILPVVSLDLALATERSLLRQSLPYMAHSLSFSER